MSSYPVAYEADFVERRSRLTTLVRWVLVIPHAIALFILFIGVYVAVIIAWFALLFTGRWPRGLYDFVAGSMRYYGRVMAYSHLASDPFPPFELGDCEDYPVRLRIGEPQESYSRLKVLFRMLLAIPVAIIAWALSIVSSVGAFLAWVVIIITGKQVQGLQSMIDLGVAYQLRAATYYCLVTEDWPPFSADD